MTLIGSNHENHSPISQTQPHLHAMERPHRQTTTTAATNEHLALQPGMAQQYGPMGAESSQFQQQQQPMMQQNPSVQYYHVDSQLQSYRPMSMENNMSQQQMMTAASNMDSAASSSPSPLTPNDLLTQGSTPIGSSSGSSKQLQATNGQQHVAANHQAQASGLSTGASSSQDQRMEFQTTGQSSSGNQEQLSNQMTLGPFQYSSGQQQSSSTRANNYSPRHLMLASQQSPSTIQLSGTSEHEFISGQPASHMQAFQQAPNEQLASFDDGQMTIRQALASQQQFVSQQMNQQPAQPVGSGSSSLLEQSNNNLPQQQQSGPRSAILNQLNRLWSMVGKQRSLLPNLASPFNTKSAFTTSPANNQQTAASISQRQITVNNEMNTMQVDHQSLLNANGNNSIIPSNHKMAITIPTA